MKLSVINSKYILIKVIGEGGFGKVWLANDDNNNFFAVKQIKNITPQSHEYKGVMHYKKISDELNSNYLIKILDIAIENDTLYYAMPLCDSIKTSKEYFEEFEENDVSEISPLDDKWEPRTLQTDIELQRSKNEWFDRHEICAYIKPIIKAVDTLSQKGFLHRDIKPANIMFFNGVPCLGDVGLLTADTVSVSSAGTPYYLAPKWFIDSHGNPDIWGLAMTLFALLSGSTPELYGRQAYRFPPQGKEKMTTKNIIAWDNYYQIILNATSKNLRERYARISDFAVDVELIATDNFNKPTPDINAQHFDTALRKHRLRKNIIMGIVALSMLVCTFFIGRYTSPPTKVVEYLPAPKSTYDKVLEFIDHRTNILKNWKTNKNIIQDFDKLIDEGINVRSDSPREEFHVWSNIFAVYKDSDHKIEYYKLLPFLVEHYSKQGNNQRVENIVKALKEYPLPPNYSRATIKELLEFSKFMHKYNITIPKTDVDSALNNKLKEQTTDELVKIYHLAKKYNLEMSMISIRNILYRRYMHEHRKSDPKSGRMASRKELFLLPKLADKYVKELLKEKEK